MIKQNLLKESILQSIRMLYQLQEEVMSGIIDMSTANAKEEILKKEILEKKKRLISEVHIGKRGDLLSFGKYNPNKGLYIVKCTDGKQLTAVSEEGLIDSLMEHYGLSLANPTVKSVFEEALKRYEMKHPDANRTIINYGYDFNRFIDKDFSSMDIRKITREYLENYTLSYVRNNRPKASALGNYKTLLNLIYEQAIFLGLVNENIAKYVKRKDYTEYCDQSLAHRKPKDVLLSDSEEKTLLEFMQKQVEKGSRNMGYAAYSFMTLLHSQLGCRPDELVSLKWSDIDFEEKIIVIERQQIEKRKPRIFEVVEYTKNEKGISEGGRPVPLSEKALDILAQLRVAKQNAGIVSDWLFSNKEGDILKKSNYSDYLRETCQKLGIKSRGTYAFRRGLSAKMEKNGICVSERAAILGHSPETNFKNYTFAPANYLENVRTAIN